MGLSLCARPRTAKAATTEQWVRAIVTVFGLGSHCGRSTAWFFTGGYSLAASTGLVGPERPWTYPPGSAGPGVGFSPGAFGPGQPWWGTTEAALTYNRPEHRFGGHSSGAATPFVVGRSWEWRLASAGSRTARRSPRPHTGTGRGGNQSADFTRWVRFPECRSPRDGSAGGLRSATNGLLDREGRRAWPARLGCTPNPRR